LRVQRDYLQKPDWELELDIENKLFWEPMIDSGTIEVDVDMGTVTLTGNVDSWYEYKLAAKKAAEAGARDIVNKLEVE